MPTLENKITCTLQTAKLTTEKEMGLEIRVVLSFYRETLEMGPEHEDAIKVGLDSLENGLRCVNVKPKPSVSNLEFSFGCFHGTAYTTPFHNRNQKKGSKLSCAETDAQILPENGAGKLTRK